MRIAIDIRNIGRQKTGSEVVVRELVSHLLQINQNDEYFLLTDTEDTDVLQAIDEKLHLTDKKNVHVISLVAANKFVWAAWNVWRWARKERPDIYHTEYILPFFMPHSVRLITHIHDVSFAALPQYIGWKDRYFLQMFIPWSLRRAARIIAVSEFTRDEIIRYYHTSTEKIDVVLNAVAPEFKTQATKEQIDTACKKYHLPQQYIFSLGTMQPRKNIPFLVEAFAQIANKMPHVSLVLSGKHGHHFDAAIKETIAQHPDILERIIFTGFIDDEDLPAVYAGAQLFVFPSLYEGFGLLLLEAMTQKVMIVASDTTVFREVAQDTIYYASPRDLAAFGDAIYTAIMCDKDERRKYIHSASDQLKLFSWSTSAKKMQSIYHSL